MLNASRTSKLHSTFNVDSSPEGIFNDLALSSVVGDVLVIDGILADRTKVL